MLALGLLSAIYFFRELANRGFSYCFILLKVLNALERERIEAVST